MFIIIVAVVINIIIIVVFNIIIIPQTSTSVVEPYNSVLTTHSSMEFSDVTFLVDNDAVFGICKDKLEVEPFLKMISNGLKASC